MRNEATKSAERVIVVGLLMVFATAAKGQVAHDSIKASMAALQPLVGSWSIAATFHGRNGSTDLDDGTFQIRPILDGTYLEVDATLVPRVHPERAHSFMQLITFNSETTKYDVTYFYSRSALRVSELGEFNAASRDFTTAAYIPREDGIRNENVHTSLRVLDPGHLRYSHFSRYDDERAETMDLEMEFTRTR